jgi:hypothetical protein
MSKSRSKASKSKTSERTPVRKPEAKEGELGNEVLDRVSGGLAKGVRDKWPAGR